MVRHKEEDMPITFELSEIFDYLVKKRSKNTLYIFNRGHVFKPYIGIYLSDDMVKTTQRYIFNRGHVLDFSVSLHI